MTIILTEVLILNRYVIYFHLPPVNIFSLDGVQDGRCHIARVNKFYNFSSIFFCNASIQVVWWPCQGMQIYTTLKQLNKITLLIQTSLLVSICSNLHMVNYLY